LRLIDIAANNPATVSLVGATGLMRWRAVAKDGADLPAVQALMQDARKLMYSGETYDFDYQSEESASLRLEVGSGPNATIPWKVVQRIEVR
jgi:hypothetical protein